MAVELWVVSGYSIQCLLDVLDWNPCGTVRQMTLHIFSMPPEQLANLFPWWLLQVPYQPMLGH